MEKEYILPINSIIWKMKGLSHLEKFILIEIYALNLKQDCFAKNAHFADLFEVSTTQVSKAISSLIKAGYIEKSEFNGRTRKLITKFNNIPINNRKKYSHADELNNIVFSEVLTSDKVHKSISNILITAIKNRFSVNIIIRHQDYTNHDFKESFERKFKEGMSWDNFGQWHIDHITPKSWFKILNGDNSLNLNQLKECWNLNNLQPLWAKENWQKHNKFKG
jgi:hypothetical protein